MYKMQVAGQTHTQQQKHNESTKTEEMAVPVKVMAK